MWIRSHSFTAGYTDLDALLGEARQGRIMPPELGTSNDDVRWRCTIGKKIDIVHNVR